MTGSATLTIVLSMPTMNRLEQQMTSTSMRRRRLSSGSGITLNDWNELIASLQLTSRARAACKACTAERFLTAGMQPERRRPAIPVVPVTSSPAPEA